MVERHVDESWPGIQLDTLARVEPNEGMGPSDCREPFETKRAYQFGRTGTGYLFSALALLALAPFMLLLALIIVIDSPGAGPIFVQERIGKNGKSFRFFKFRSMVPQAEEKLGELLKDNEMDGPVFKIKEDPRITRLVSLFERPASMNCRSCSTF